jgi:hypothetical protein
MVGLQTAVQQNALVCPLYAVLFHSHIIVAVVVRNELPCFFMQGKEHFGVAHHVPVLLPVMCQRNVLVGFRAVDDLDINGHIGFVRVVDFGCLQG